MATGASPGASLCLGTAASTTAARAFLSGLWTTTKKHSRRKWRKRRKKEAKQQKKARKIKANTLPELVAPLHVPWDPLLLALNLIGLRG